MNTSGTLELISVSHTNDSYGVAHGTEKKRQVFCRVKSISATEFARVGLSGLKPAWVFTLNQDEYRGETEVRYQGRKYSVYRTYQTSRNRVEVYVEVKAGG